MKFSALQSAGFFSILKKYFGHPNLTSSPEPLAQLVRTLRREDFEAVLDYLRESPQICENLSVYLHRVFEGKTFVHSLTEADILSENSFIPELKKRVLNTFLPPVEDENTVWYLVDFVSYNTSRDLKFFANVEPAQLDEFFRLLRIDRIITRKSVKKGLLFSMNILCWRAIGNAMATEVVNMAPEYRNYDNPFLALQEEMDQLKKIYTENPDFVLTSKDENYKQIKIYLQHCLEFIETSFKNTDKYGISGKINQSLMQIKQQIIRIQEILELLVIDSEDEEIKKSESLFFAILTYKSRKNNVRQLVDDSTTLMSHLITNHTAETGTHYITSGFSDYVKMFWKASGGGIVVGFLCVLKTLYGTFHGSEFSHAFLYAFNYAMGFIIIYLMGFTLATKQPAMTAATMAKVLSEGENTEKNYTDFAHLVAKLFRTQFIAFVGNVLWAFPVALLLIYGLDVILNLNLAEAKSDKLIHDLDPVHSKAILHACLAGIFLFFSGIIAGNIGNNSVYYRIPRRIANNTLIIGILGKNSAEKISKFYSRNWAGIVSNFWFGVFLGVTAPIGIFFGLDLDIRHITFAAGNLALGWYGKNFEMGVATFWTSFATVFIIGFFNFAVSFGLSMMLAFRSRQVNLGELREIIKAIVRYFFKNPLRFFFPLRSYLDTRAREMIQKSVPTESED